MADETRLRAETFPNRAAALGAAVNFTMTKPAFARLPFGHWARVLTGQINRGHYFFVFREKTVVGFCGWSLANKEDAEAWLKGGSPPGLEEGKTGECLMLNAWVAANPAANRFIFDHLRVVGKGKYALYGKRDYPDGRTRRLRLLGNQVFAKHVEALQARPRPDAAAVDPSPVPPPGIRQSPLR
jgi:hemolysin-activating ACP:hemolysin acyltransferase